MGGWGSIPRPTHFISEEETRYPFNRILSEAQGRSERVLKILPPTGIRSPDRPARSEPRVRITTLRPLSAEAKVHLQTSPCRICGGQRGNGTGFFPLTSGFPCQYHSTNAAYSCTYDRPHIILVIHNIVTHFLNRRG